MDLIIIAVYLLFTLIAAFAFGHRNAYKEYFFCQKRYSLLPLTATLFAAAVGAASIFFVAEAFYKQGFKFFFVLSGNYLSQFLIGVFVVAKMQRWLSKLTPAEVIADLYSPKLQAWCGLAASLVSTGFVAVQIHAFGYIIAYFYDASREVAVILGGLFTIFYTAYGGINAVIRTDIFQFCVMITAIFLLSRVGVNEVGGVGALLRHSDFAIWNWNFSKSDLMFWLKLTLVGFNPSFIQRVFIAQNINQASNATILYNCLVIVFYLAVGLCGVSASILFPNIEAKMSIPHLINHMVPLGVKGILIAGFLASVMSTASADLNIAAVSVYRDILKCKHVVGLIAVKRISIVLGALAICIALKFDSIIEILFFVTNFWSITFMCPLIFGIMGLKLSYQSVLYSICTALVASVIWEFYLKRDSILDTILIGTLINILCLFVFHFVAKYINRSLCHEPASIFKRKNQPL